MISPHHKRENSCNTALRSTPGRDGSAEHLGDIYVDHPGFFVVPESFDSNRAASTETIRSGSQGSLSMNVLLVEDDINFAKVVDIRLRGWRRDVRLHHAKTLAEAKKFLDDENIVFQLLILDQHLPDGLSVSLYEHPRFQLSAILAVSADEAPEIPGRAVGAGAQHFLAKRQLTEPHFIPLLEALLSRKELERKEIDIRDRESRMKTIRLLLATLRHEINNPLGAVLGGAYLLKTGGSLAEEQKEALRLIEASGNRIKHVIQQLCDTADLEEVIKGQEAVFQIPGDPKWATGPKSAARKRPTQKIIPQK